MSLAWNGMELWKWVVMYNGVVVLVYGWDKWCATRGAWRVPERTLLGLALCAGAAGALIGIYLFRHKTRKPVFAVGVPVLLAVQVGLVLWTVVRGR